MYGQSDSAKSFLLSERDAQCKPAMTVRKRRAAAPPKCAPVRTYETHQTKEKRYKARRWRRLYS